MTARTCEACGGEISPARLTAQPSTWLCAPCKARNDEVPLTAYSPLVAPSLVVTAALTGAQERATERREKL